MTNIEERFDGDRVKLMNACERLALLLPSSDPINAARLQDVAGVLRGPSSWEAQARAAASLRGLFHRDGLDDRPPPVGSTGWDEDLKTLWDLSTIYVESRYGEVAAKRAAPTGDHGA